MAIYKRNKIWWIDYYANGERKREPVGASHKLAQEVLHKRKLEIAEGNFFPHRQIQSIGFSEMAELYWDLHAKQKPSAQVTQYQLNQMKSHFGKKLLKQITIPDILAYLNRIKEQHSAATANRHHNTIRAIFNRAIEWDKFEGSNPAAKVKQFRIENARLRFLEKEDVPRLLAACDKEIQPIVICAIMTGMRRGEILALRWESIDLGNGIIYVLETKSGKPREIPIAPKLAEMLKSIRKGDGGLVFEITARSLNRHFTKALKVAGIPNFRFHDLRHTFASHFVMETNDLPATQNLLGHHSPRMTQRYVHLSKDHLKAGIQHFDAGWSQIWSQAVPAKSEDIKKDGNLL